MLEINKIYNMDGLKGMRQMPDESVDLVLTDPPYNIGVAEWDNKQSIKEYIKWLEPFIDEYIRVLKDNGSLYIFGNYNFIGDIKVLLNKYKFKLMSWIIWDKGSKEQNATRTYSDVTEHILFFIKGLEKDIDITTETNKVRDYLRGEKEKSGLTNKYFSEEFSKFYNKVGCRDRSVIEHYFSEKQWIFPVEEIYKVVLQKTGFFKRDYEELKKEYLGQRYIFNHESIRLQRNPKDKRKFSYVKQIHPNVWYYNNKSEMTKYNHPTVKPIELIGTIIKASSNEGNLILDSFMGSGTTAVACKRLNRNFIGFEISKEYCDIAEKRLERVNEYLEAPW